MKIRTPYRPLALFAWQRDDAPTRVSTESGQASGLSHAANCNAGIADRKFALAVSGR